MLNRPRLLHASTCAELLTGLTGSTRGVSFHDNFDAPRRLAFGELYAAALRTLGRLQDHGLAPGDTMLLIAPRNEAFLIAFWAALLGGIVPVPLAIGTTAE